VRSSAAAISTWFTSGEYDTLAQGSSTGFTSEMTMPDTSSKLLMYQPGLTSNRMGKPAWCDSRCHIWTFSRPNPLNSGIRSEMGVVNANRPCSMACRTSTLVKALVTEKMLNTDDSDSGSCCCASADPIAASSATLPPRATLMTAP
jgi:hypothetical protein